MQSSGSHNPCLQDVQWEGREAGHQLMGAEETPKQGKGLESESAEGRAGPVQPVEGGRVPLRWLLRAGPRPA